MWGYKHYSEIEKPRLLMRLFSIMLIIGLFIVRIYWPNYLSEESLTVLIAATIGLIVTFENIYVQNKLSLRQELNIKAINDIGKAMNDFQGAAAVSATFGNSFVVKPLQIHNGFWCETASEKFMNMHKHLLSMREANSLYTAIESNEIAVIHLEQYYLYIAIQIDEFFKRADSLLATFSSETSSWGLTEEQYNQAIGKFNVLQNDWVEIVGYFIDMRKLLQNELLGTIFNRRLMRRRPKAGLGTTLDKVATLPNVNELIKKQEDNLNNNK